MRPGPAPAEDVTVRRRFEGQVALVTGGGRGLGSTVARALGAEGACVVVMSRTAAEVRTTVRSLRAGGAAGLAAPGDVRNPADVERAVRSALDAFGRLDVLVNAAGVFRMGPSTDSTLDEWREVIDTNLTGVYLCCQAAGVVMLA